MLKSMTGYGKGQAPSAIGTLLVEIRSLNHKYFDLVCRLPNHLSVYEEKVRDYVKKRIRRGRINLAVSWEFKEQMQTPFSLDVRLAKRYYQQLKRLRKSLGLKNDLGVMQLVTLPEVIKCEQKQAQAEDIWPALLRALELALTKLERMREAEGRRLMRDLRRQDSAIQHYLHRIEQQLPKTIRHYRQNLLKKVKAVSGVKTLAQDKVAEEAVLFMRNSDVSEELTRIKSHLKAFKSALRNQREAGKELDFVAQELFREANTIGAKASDFRISRWVIKMKSQIEKIREQLQNVE